MKSTLNSRWSATRRKFIEAGGNTTQSFGLGRVLGQIYALLYMTPKPLCLDDIADELGVSKASVSTTARQLERWSAIKRVWVKGDRKDYYEAETDFRAVLRNGLLDAIRKKLDTASMHFDSIEKSLTDAMEQADREDLEEIQVVAKRFQNAKKFYTKVNGLFSNPLLDHLL